MENLNINKTGYVIGILSIIFFLACTAWGVLLPTQALKELHFSLLQMAYPGFAFTLVGYVIGVIEAFIYGWFAGVLFAWLCKQLCVTNEATST